MEYVIRELLSPPSKAQVLYIHFPALQMQRRLGSYLALIYKSLMEFVFGFLISHAANLQRIRVVFMQGQFRIKRE